MCLSVPSGWKESTTSEPHTPRYQENKSKAAAPDSNNYTGAYPFARLPSNSVQGDVKTSFVDLEMFVGVAIDPKADNECLVRRDNDLLYWSERTMMKLEESKGSDEQRQMEIMFTLLHVLVLDTDEDLSEGSYFETFMGGFNLAVN